MMNYKIREELAKRISQVDESNILNTLKDVLESDFSDNVLQLTREQYDELNLSMSDIKEGSYIENRIFKKQVRSWLKGR